MRINDVEKMTGLTQKAIRLYERKGLISISRDENGYRNYSEDDIGLLRRIRLLRSIGIPIADIKLYVFGVVSIDEIVDKRKAEIRKESGRHSEMYRLCEEISQRHGLDGANTLEVFVENEEMRSKAYGALSVGVDIGTTTISAVVYDIENREQLETYTLPHNSYFCADIRSEQSVSLLMEKAEKLLFHILDCYEGIVSIGLSGQMHGIVYIDADGNPLSELINWQDKRADRMLVQEKTVCEYIEHTTGEHIATGYGIATHCCNMHHGMVPENAAGFCSIMDLFAMRLCGLKKVVCHASVAASFGLFDVKNGDFMQEKLALLGIDRSFLPDVTQKSRIVGHCRDIPVSVALGDNQASFLGSVRDGANSILVNIGTGSQVSAMSDYRESHGEVEVRPFVEGKYLICGSALCGGLAYAMLEAFFRSYTVSAGRQESSQYSVINRLSAEAYENGEEGLEVDVSFLGKRSDPDRRGSVQGIDRQNFTPAALALGVLKGMCNELYELYAAFGEKKTHIAASGGAVKRNAVLQKLIAERFDMTVSVSGMEEEAATGAALFAAFAAGRIPYANGFPEYIKER